MRKLVNNHEFKQAMEIVVFVADEKLKLYQYLSKAGDLANFIHLAAQVTADASGSPDMWGRL